MGELLGHLIGLAPGKSIVDIPEGYAVLITGILVIFGWYISARQSTNAFRREKANKYLLADSHPVYPILKKLTNPYFMSRVQFPRYGDLANDPQLNKDIREALVYFEFAAVDIRHGLVSEHYIYVSQRSLTMNVFQQSRRYILSVRELHNQPSAFRSFETHYIRLAHRHLSLLLDLIEFVLHRPWFAATRFIFRCQYRMGSLGRQFDREPLAATPAEVAEAMRRATQLINLMRILIVAVLAWALWP
ncbi:hypothetical protein [Mesorhizobium sp. BH1-1-4]|uniref:DUF4760 domain-containing protein n=1 Tax=Mesorhizobium sp. BH1-1-4 TaxID=2876662 RepID=UPI001CD0DAB4|nr:hypothetical protein [Mesorhizobium sp. BH1-1-4]MBZ9993137.1 hypothetical protein [Mesorhizobium sp. BH1-1-4]